MIIRINRFSEKRLVNKMLNRARYAVWGAVCTVFMFLEWFYQQC